MERATSAVIVNAIAHVRILLNLGEQNPLPDRVNRPRRNKNHIAAPRRFSVENFKQRIIFNAGNKLITRNFLIEAAIQQRIFVGVEDVPHFIFAELPLVIQSIIIGRMHLHGKIFSRVNELYQKRELLKASAIFS